MLTSSKVAEEFGDILPPPLGGADGSGRPPTSPILTSLQSFQRMIREAVIDTHILHYGNPDFVVSSLEQEVRRISEKYHNAFPRRTIRSISVKTNRIIKKQHFAVISIRFNTLESEELTILRDCDLEDDFGDDLLHLSEEDAELSDEAMDD